MSNLLNPRQQDRVIIVLQTFEENLRSILQWMNDSEEQGILYRKNFQLPAEHFPKISVQVNEALDIIGRLAEDLSLSPREENATRTIVAKMSMDWEALSSCHSEDLKSAGRVHPDLPKVLDQSIDRLSQIALELALILGQSPDQDHP